jgi:opacity protein-like surface antigen
MNEARAALAALLVCTLAGVAHAQTTNEFARTGFSLGLGGTYAFHWFPGDFDDEVGARTITDNSFGLNANLGYRPLSWLAGELEYEWVDGFTNKVMGSKVFDLSFHTITANAKFIYPGWGRFQPYGLGGIGVSIINTSDRSGLGVGLDSSSAGFGARVGVGLDAYITKNWVANVEGGAVFSTTTVDNSNPAGSDLKSLWYVPIQFGIQYRF